ncbi:MAG: hypothetical protein K2X66_06720 [Cyanobacteria bacterium]|nr:hypothetical protein [Cyanobacteriota bacterium]
MGINRLNGLRRWSGALGVGLVLAGTIGMTVLLNPVAEAASQNGFMMFNLADEPNSKNVKVLNARILVDAPPIFVWQTLTNYSKLKDFLPGYEKTDVVSSESSGAKILDIAMNVARFFPTCEYRLRVNENRQSYELKMNRISGDFNHLAATYQLYPRNNGSQTILAYSIKIDPGDGIPGFAFSPVLKTNTEKTLKAIQSRSQAEHRKSLIGQR